MLLEQPYFLIVWKHPVFIYCFFFSFCSTPSCTLSWAIARFLLMCIDPFYTSSLTHHKVICDTSVFYFGSIFRLFNTVWGYHWHPTYWMTYNTSGHQMLPKPLLGEAEDIPRAGKYPKHMPLIIYLAYLQSIWYFSISKSIMFLPVVRSLVSLVY